MKEPKVALVMGSKSDMEHVKKAEEIMDLFEIRYTKHIYSAHRTPNELKEFIQNQVNPGSYEVVIAFAGMAAALAGVIASETVKPVIGVPLSGGKFNGIEALLATIEMPPGVPVLTVGIDAAKNAALAATRIIAISDKNVSSALKQYYQDQADAVKFANNEINRK